MTETPRSSFIPKQTTAGVPSRARRRRKYNVFGFAATTLLISSIVLAVGVFFYKDLMSSKLMAQKEALQAQRSLFNEADIANVRDLHHQLAAAGHLLDGHLSFSKIFDTLELTTKESVQFTGLTLEQRPSRDVSIVVTGATEEFTSVALQALQFESDSLMRNSLFTDLTTADKAAEQLLNNAEGNSQSSDDGEEEPHVTFSVEGNIDAAYLAFEGEEIIEIEEVTLEEGEGEGEGESEFDDMEDLDTEFSELEDVFEEGDEEFTQSDSEFE